jgi:AraC family transcriptional regulator
MRSTELLQVLSELRTLSGRNVSLSGLAKRSGWSPFHLHRVFRRALGETPKQYTQRQRLERAAATLAMSSRTVAEIARDAGFASHEVFTRAFRRHFGCTPQCYRARALTAPFSLAERRRHAEIVQSSGPCIRLYHFPTQSNVSESLMPVLSIARVERAAQPVLYIRRRIARSELPGMLAECFGTIFAHCQQAGLAIAGPPVARYVSMGPGQLTVDAAMVLAAPAKSEGEMQAGTLPAGPAAMGVHAGPYEGLPDTNAAIERWIDSQGLRVGGDPWESYVTDPGQFPDPADWRTEVYWPLATD